MRLSNVGRWDAERASTILAFFRFLSTHHRDRFRPSFHNEDGGMMRLEIHHISDPHLGEVDPVEHVGKLSNKFHAHS